MDKIERTVESAALDQAADAVRPMRAVCVRVCWYMLIVVLAAASPSAWCAALQRPPPAAASVADLRHRTAPGGGRRGPRADRGRRPVTEAHRPRLTQIWQRARENRTRAVEASQPARGACPPPSVPPPQSLHASRRRSSRSTRSTHRLFIQGARFDRVWTVYQDGGGRIRVQLKYDTADAVAEETGPNK